MEEELNDLLTQAQENISDNVDKQTEFTYRKVLEESMKELDNNTKCWWCRYNFNTERVELPENYYNDYFYCIGNFCSYNCATSYNIELNDENVFKRQSLLHLQYKKIYNGSK